MFKPEPLTRRGSLRSLRSAPLLSTVLESTLSLTRIHPITSLELPGLDYAVESESAIGAPHHREIGASLRSGIAAITAANAGTSTVGQQSVVATLQRNLSVRHTEHKRNLQPKRALSRKFKPHIVADTVKQNINRAQPTTKGSSQQQPNMEFLRGVYAFMQVSRSSVEYNSATTTSNVNTIFIEAIPTKTTTTNSTTITTTTEKKTKSKIVATTTNDSSSSTLKFLVHHQHHHHEHQQNQKHQKIQLQKLQQQQEQETNLKSKNNIKDIKQKRTNVEKSSQKNQINKCTKTIESKETAQILENESNSTNQMKSNENIKIKKSKSKNTRATRTKKQLDNIITRIMHLCCIKKQNCITKT